MRALKVLLAINGAIFLGRGSLDIVQPTNFYLESNAPKYALDAVRVIGITYLTVGLIQLGMWRVTDRLAVRVVAGASLLFGAAVAVQAVTQGSGSADAFHRLAPGPAVENALVALLYAALLYRESRTTARRISRRSAIDNT